MYHLTVALLQRIVKKNSDTDTVLQTRESDGEDIRCETNRTSLLFPPASLGIFFTAKYGACGFLKYYIYFFKKPTDSLSGTSR